MSEKTDECPACGFALDDPSETVRANQDDAEIQCESCGAVVVIDLHTGERS